MGVHVSIFDRPSDDGAPWLVVEAFSTRNGSANPPPAQRLERREVRARYEAGKLVHTAAERQYESRDVAAAKLLSELYAVLHAELQGKIHE
jgi:hypothetical protein